MTEIENHQAALLRIESEAGRFPPQMLLIPNLFEFWFREYQGLLAEAFSSNSELLAALRTTLDFIEESDLQDDEKEEIIDALHDEIEVVSYSNSARCSVIAM
jgi:hypothetical protein